ncbi:hypothetical protein SAY87_019500 [Trapa incisa]|uniref:Uncharacterized protein n=1 Tax=Trapa incisa TaxID=236973 RepID=A0AAN7K2E0_9MYRT|nr:hypothetical protein SAY87_019500 [Trapa incisa]
MTSLPILSIPSTADLLTCPIAVTPPPSPHTAAATTVHHLPSADVPLSSVESPFVQTVVYHRFAAEPARPPDDLGADAVVVRSPVRKLNFYIRFPECSPSANNLSPEGPCRYDSSLGAKEENLLHNKCHRRDWSDREETEGHDTMEGLDASRPVESDLGVGSLQAEVDALSIMEHGLDERIRDLEERLGDLSENGDNQRSNNSSQISLVSRSIRKKNGDAKMVQKDLQ